MSDQRPIFEDTVRERLEAMLAAIGDVVRDAVFVKDRDGRWLFANAATLAIVGQPLEGVLGKTDGEIYSDPAIGAALMAIDRRIMDSGRAEVVEEIVQAADGYRVFSTVKAPVRDRDGRVTGLVGCAHDVTDRKRTEDELATQRRLLSDILDGTPALIFAFDLEGRVSLANAAAARLTGLTKEELRGRLPGGRVPADLARDLARRHAEVVASGSPQIAEVVVPTADGDRILIANRYPLRDGQGRVYGSASITTDVTEQKRAEAALRESEARLVEAQRNARIGSWRRVPGAPLVWSAQMFELFKLPRDVTPTEERVLSAIHPEDRAAYRAALAAALVPDGPDFEVDCRVVWPDRQVRTLHWLAEIWRDPDGRVEEMVGTVQDVTELKRSEAQARHAAERLALLADASQAFAAAGLDAPAIVGELVRHVSRSLADGCLVRLLSDDGAAPRSADGPGIVVPLRVRGAAIGTMTLTRVSRRPDFSADDLSLAQDLADRAALSIDAARLFQAARRELQERQRAEIERERLTTAIEQAAETVMVTDGSGSIVYANPAFEAVTGYSRSEVVGANPRLLQSGVHDRAFYRALWDTLQAGRTWHGRLINKKKDGTRFTEEATISPVRDASGATTSYVAVKRDITREIAMEAQLLQAQRMESIGVLAGGIAHDFNNILSVILASAGFAQEDLPAEHPVREDILEIERAATRAAALTRQLLAFGRKQVLQPEPLELNRVLAEMEKMLRRILGEDIELARRLAPDLGIVTADPSQVEQVIMNLAVNARDAMPRGGKLVIETCNVELDGDFVAQHAGATGGPHVMLAVSDSGVGMDADTLARAFEPFFTTKPPGKGTGLGLSTVYGIVRQSGGVIDVTSEPGKGTTFRICLPRELARAPAARAAPPAARAGGDETILIVEDDEAVRGVARRMLGAAGYRVLEAGNGAEGLLVCKRHGGKIDLVLTDVVMPGMGGRDFAELLAKVRPDSKVLYMSGYTDDTILHHGVLEEGTRFIAKPLAQAELLRKVRETLGE